MDELVVQRIKYFTDKEEISQAEVAKMLLTTNDLVSKWFTAKQKMPYSIFLELVKKLERLNLRWAFTGEGPMLNDQEITANEVEGFKITRIDCEQCILKDKQIKTQEKFIALLEKTNARFEAEINELKTKLSLVPKDKIGYKPGNPEIEKAADPSPEALNKPKKNVIRYYPDFFSHKVD